MKKVIAYEISKGTLISEEEAERIKEMEENGPLSDVEKAYELRIKEFKKKTHEVFDVPDSNTAETAEALEEILDKEGYFIEAILDNILELPGFHRFDEFVGIMKDLLFGYTDEVEELLEFVKKNKK